MQDRRLRYLCAATIAVVAACCLPLSAFADKGSGHGGDSHSGSGGSGDHGSGDDSGSSGSGSSGHGGRGHDGHDDKGGGDRRGDGKRGDDDRRDGGDEKRSYKGGWREQIRKGSYEVFDPAGRLVIRRKVTLSDYLRF